ncbi:MAG: type II toxin-antitoxin system VapC family toxin [Candidatus Solibacter sp.]
MKGFLLDTNCISELVSVKPEPRVLDWIGSADELLLFVSVLTLGEIRKGIAGLKQGKRRDRLTAWLDTELTSRFEGRLLVIDSQVAQQWGVLAAKAARVGRPLPVIDGLLAATALCHELTVVTRNESDFLNTGVTIWNPWKA